MARLSAECASAFLRDVKRLHKKHVDDAPLAEVVDLILENTFESLAELRRRHNIHTLSGSG